MGVCRFNFLRSQRWAFEFQRNELSNDVTTEDVFEGYCCFQTQNHYSLLFKQQQDENQQHCSSDYISFKSLDGELSDPRTIKCTLFLLKQESQPMELSNKNSSSNQNVYLLGATMDGMNFLIDHTQIMRIFKPSIESEVAFIVFDFNNVLLRIYDMDEKRDASRKMEYMTRVLNSLMNHLKPIEDINLLVRKLFHRSSASILSGTNALQALYDKYSKWVSFLNKMNKICSDLMTLHPRTDSNLIEQQLNDLCTSYLDSILTFSELRQMYGDDILSSNLDIRDFAQIADKMEKQLEKEIENEVIQLFSFSTNRTAPSEEALDIIQKKMDVANQLSQQNLLLSCLYQKHFHK
jgi:hypothetical protein